jgi:ubiquitin carboxyl-terminal hydrolase 9/24
LSNEVICKGCPHYSEREEMYLSINLPVKNKKSIIECLSSFVQGDMLEGENAYFCEICDKKVSALKRVCVKKLPNTLIMVLKRFDIDFDTM